jgi:ribosomal protein S18 acetylase RimI-like enzyme
VDLVIRKYEEKDEEQVINLWKQCNLIVPQNDPHENIKKKMEFQPNLFFIGTVNNEVVASIMIGYEGYRGWINYIAVIPEYRNKGFGRQLVNKAIDELKKLGCLKVNLQVRKYNKDVIEFYENLGFSNDRVVSLGKHL